MRTYITQLYSYKERERREGGREVGSEREREREREREEGRGKERERETERARQGGGGERQTDRQREIWRDSAHYASSIERCTSKIVKHVITLSAGFHLKGGIS